MTRPDDHDDLLLRYREANAEDTHRPGAHVREAVRAHAEMMMAPPLVASRAFGGALPLSSPEGAELARGGPSRRSPPGGAAAAANQSRWKISLLAGVALAGLTGLLVLQFDRGTPEEQEAVYGRPSPSASPPISASPEQPATQASPPSAAPGETAALPKSPSVPRAAAPKSASGAMPKPASPQADLSTARGEQAAREAAPAPPATTSAAPGPEMAQAATPAPLADVAPGAAPAGELRRAPPAPAPRAAAAPAPAVRASAPLQQQESFTSQAPRSRAETGGNAQDLAAALHEAARTGRVPQLERLLAQGAPLNAPDAAGRTPLMLAVIHGHTTMVQRLLALGANPALLDRDGLNALQHARRLGLDRIAGLIEAGS